MANRQLFQSLPAAQAVNEAGGRAYQPQPRHILAQYALTGCLNSTFYAGAETQLQRVLECCAQVDPLFVGKTAVQARKGHMKDMPALLCAWLSAGHTDILAKVFPRVMDNAKMLRNFMQIVRSGVVGRRSFGSLPRRLIRQWLEGRTEEQLLRDSVGTDPSLVDVIRMIHPRPADPSREAFYGYLLGRKVEAGLLPPLVQAWERFKSNPSSELPDLPFQMLSSRPLDSRAWTAIARRASWQTLRMNLNTFQRHGVFDDASMVKLLADRLRNPEAIRRARVFPYQLLQAYVARDPYMPAALGEALQDALEIAVEAVPKLEGRTVICCDVSGSMQSPLTGHRKGSTTAVRCIDAAALLSAAILRRNPGAFLLPFESRAIPLNLNPRDSILTLARQLADIGGGGTNCSAPLAWLNKAKLPAEQVIYLSDNQSWLDTPEGRGTEMMRQWQIFRQCNPCARLVCLDLQPYGTVQAQESPEILNIGGFSDQIFQLLSLFSRGEMAPDHWVDLIEQTEL